MYGWGPSHWDGALTLLRLHVMLLSILFAEHLALNDPVDVINCVLPSFEWSKYFECRRRHVSFPKKGPEWKPAAVDDNKNLQQKRSQAVVLSKLCEKYYNPTDDLLVVSINDTTAATGFYYYFFLVLIFGTIFRDFGLVLSIRRSRDGPSENFSWELTSAFPYLSCVVTYNL